MRRWQVVAVAIVGLACTKSRQAPQTSAEGGETTVTSATSAPAKLEREAPSEAKAPDVGDSDAARAKRAELVRQVVDSGYVKSDRVRDAMKRVPRHAFVAKGTSLDEAYADMPLPIGFGQTISQPSVVGGMTEALELKGGERVLEIGTGSGYQAAILSVLAKEVYTIEILPELGERAAKRLGELGYANVQVRVGDGYAGWPDKAPFDRIILTAAPPEVPQALIDQLADGGILVAPVGQLNQWLVRIDKKDGKVKKRTLEEVRFVPMVKEGG